MAKNLPHPFVMLVLAALLVTAVTACTAAPTPTALPATAAAAILPESTPTLSVIAEAEPYPVIITTAVPPAYPAYPAVETETAVPAQPTASIPPPENGSYTFLPLITQADTLTETAVLAEPSPTNTLTPTPVPTVDFAAVKAQLQAQGQDIGYAKIGFHVGIGGNTEGLEQWLRELDAAGVPFFLKSVDNAEPILFAQELMKASGVPHVLVYRKVSGGNHVSVPNYDQPPAEAAAAHWALHRDAFPPELDRNYVWVETMNEVDKNRSEWLAQFALEHARLTLQDGFKWAAFGWSSGEPEPEQWQAPSMMAFLRLVGSHPDRLAIALHEYSYLVDDITDAYPYKIGRFQELFRIADANGIPRPTVLITEWGWTYEHVPEPGPALEDIAWASALYAPYPQVKGAAIWYLGAGDTFADIANEAQRLIDPVRVYALTHYFAIPQPPEQQPINPAQHQP
ncbi:MAG: hypothetical protein R6X34_08250 [Chloroflexota bacterium]